MLHPACPTCGVNLGGIPHPEETTCPGCGRPIDHGADEEETRALRLLGAMWGIAVAGSLVLDLIY